jgi:hypothetical protein
VYAVLLPPHLGRVRSFVSRLVAHLPFRVKFFDTTQMDTWPQFSPGLNLLHFSFWGVF